MWLIVNEILYDIVILLVFVEVVDFIVVYKLCGCDVVVVLVLGEEIVGLIVCVLGVIYVMVIWMIVEDGKYIGEVVFYCYGEGKV